MFYSYKSTDSNVEIYRNNILIARAKTFNAAQYFVTKDKISTLINNGIT